MAIEVIGQGICLLRGQSLPLQPEIEVADVRCLHSLCLTWCIGTIACTLLGSLAVMTSLKLVGAHVFILPVVAMITHPRRSDSLLNWSGLYRLHCLTAVWYPLGGIGWGLVGSCGLMAAGAWYLWAVTVCIRPQTTSTLKELGLERGKFILKPHNPAYPVIRPKDQLELFGVVTGLVRRYQG